MSANERWLPVVGFEETYQVSSLGRILSLPRAHARGRVLRRSTNAKGYLSVSLVQDGVQVAREVHTLVARAFLGPRPEGLQVRHLNGDPLDPRLENLTYGTRRQNALDAVAHGKNRNTNKTHCPAGHPYDEVNTYVSKAGWRRCRTCTKASHNRRYAERRSAR